VLGPRHGRLPAGERRGARRGPPPRHGRLPAEEAELELTIEEEEEEGAN